MSAHDRILERLRSDPAHLEELVTILIDEAVERPVAELVDPGWLAHALADGIAEAASSPQLEAWVRGRVDELLRRTDVVEGTLADHIPVTLLGPLEAVVGRELTPDPELVRALLDHPSLRELIAAILQANMLEFGRRLRSFVPDSSALPGAKLRSRLAGMAKGVAAAVGSEVERQLEERVRGYVDDALGRAVDMAIERFSAPEFAPQMARWRVDVMHGLLRHPLPRLIAERHKYPPELFAADLTAFLRALAGWKPLASALESGLERMFVEIGDQTVGAWLQGSGLEQAWRPRLEQLMTARLHALAHTDAFARWLAALTRD